MKGCGVKRIHGPSPGGWIGILYTSFWTFSLVSGGMVHASSIQGFIASVALGFVAAGVLWLLIAKVPHRPGKAPHE